MITSTPQRFQNIIDKPLVINRLRQVNVPKVTGVALIMQIAHARVVRAAVHGLPIDLRLVPGDARRDLFAADGVGLCHAVLPQLVRVRHSELELFHASESDARVSEILGGLGV